MCISRTVAGLATLVAIAAGPALSDTLTIGPSQDNTIYSENGDISNDLSNGAGDYFFTGATKNSSPGNLILRRGLVAFDIAGSVPAGSTINSVILTLYMSRSRTQDETVDLHRVVTDWGEGTSHANEEEGEGISATTDDATWSHSMWPSTTWSTPGGDFSGTASGTTTVGGQNGDYTWLSTAGMVSDVQGWLDSPSGNYGWIVIGNETASRVAKRFNSRENGDSSRRPRLEIDFTPVALTGACCALDGSCSIVLDPGTTCISPDLYQGSSTTCSPNLCPQPTGACCIADVAGTCNEVTEATCTTSNGTFQGEFTTCGVTDCPIIPTPYVDALPLPAAAVPVSGTAGGVATYDIAMREVQQQLHSELPNPTTVWGYGDQPSGAGYPGPTIEASSNQAVTVNWINDLRDTSGDNSLRTTHYLPIDTCPHGADDQSPKTVVHVHGAHVPADSDGHPEATFTPGNQVTYHYPNNQLPSTIWYHDHGLGITRLNVYMGLAGFYLIRDAFENALGLPAGEFEIPLAIQDRSFKADGSLEYPATWQDHFFGETMLVNGKVWPFHDVKQGKYRLRLLNGCNSRTLTLEFCPGSNTSPCPSPASFQLIGQEGGLIEHPVSMTSVTLGNGERADIIVDFSPYDPYVEEGDGVYLVNSAPAPFPGPPGVGVVSDVMEFRVQAETGFTGPVPVDLRTMEVLDEADATEFRTFELKKANGDACSPFIWEVVTTDGLNGPVLGSRWEDITEFPQLGDTEVWSFANRSGITHPMHMHLVMFQVLDRQAFDNVGGLIKPIGSPVAPPAHEAGWKDTVQVGPNEIVRVIARFDDYTGRFAYHCHILEHEDHEMMREFQVVPEPSQVLMLLTGAACLRVLVRRRKRA